MEQTDGFCVSDCTRCPDLVDSRSRIVNGVGPAEAALLFVGEGPGKTEDQQGEPFVGRSGSVLDDALGEAGLLREEVRITNCVRCRPPENRDPTTDELANCRGYLNSEISTVDPDLVVTLGKFRASTSWTDQLPSPRRPVRSSTPALASVPNACCCRSIPLQPCMTAANARRFSRRSSGPSTLRVSATVAAPTANPDSASFSATAARRCPGPSGPTSRLCGRRYRSTRTPRRPGS